MADAPRTGHAPPAGKPALTVRSSPLAIPADHPAYAGHFPGNPVLPGVILLDAAVNAITAMNAIAAATPADGQPGDPPCWEVVSAKFHEVVRPGDALFIEHQALANDTVRFTIRKAHLPVASGTLKRLQAAARSR